MRLRPSLIAASAPASGRYADGAAVFDRLLSQISPAQRSQLNWQLRIVEDEQFNAYSSPDGSVYVESGLARLVGHSSGIWSAILSHEMAHILQRDSARRYLYEKSLKNAAGSDIVLGDPGLPSASWSNASKASADLALFCRQLEVEADRQGLMLMARAGYHPDFMPALHHLLHAQSGSNRNASLFAMHPCWEERDHDLSQAYVKASIEFERLWPEWYSTPGGNPPVLVFTEEPRIRKNGQGAWEIQVPIRCQNLSGAVEVVVRTGSLGRSTIQKELVTPTSSQDQDDAREVTGCTSPRTTITVSVPQPHGGHRNRWADIYVLDAWGQILARADLPKLH